MFWKRLLSGIILVLLALGTIVSGGYVLFVTLLAVSLIGLYELYRMMGIQKQGFSLLTCVGYCAAILYYLILLFGFEAYTMEVCIFFLIILMAVYVFRFPAFKAEEIMIAFFGLFYVAVMLSYIMKVRNMTDGAFLVWLIFLCSWGCDTCAYCVGMLIGKHKMAPVLSPKKSVEGAVGGVVGAGLLGGIYAFIVGDHLIAMANPVITYALICAAGALLSMVGDLAASAIKRNRGIKDYGNLIPGHGGILDRFDSVIFTAPVIYMLAVLFI